MQSLMDKMNVIESLLRAEPCPEIDDLSEAECILISNEFNVRFKQTSSGYMCFVSPQPGLSGLGKSRLQAFALMLGNLGFKPNSSQNIYDQVEAFFASSRSQGVC